MVSYLKINNDEHDIYQTHDQLILKDYNSGITTSFSGINSRFFSPTFSQDGRQFVFLASSNGSANLRKVLDVDAQKQIFYYDIEAKVLRRKFTNIYNRWRRYSYMYINYSNIF